MYVIEYLKQMKIITLLSLILLFLNGISQSTSSYNSENQTITKKNSYVIGIGNSDNSEYNKVLTYLQEDNAIEVYATCKSHNTIGFVVQTNTYKSYDVVRDNLLNEFERLKLYRKDDSIFSEDCSNEIKKQ